MRKTMRLIPVVLAAVLTVSAQSLPADEEAVATFQSLYGKDIADAEASVGADDDVELAQELLTAAEKAVSQPALLEEMCNAAYRLGNSAPSGYDTAIGAMELLARTVPEKSALCRSRIATVLGRKYLTSRGEERLEIAQEYFNALKQAGDESLRTGQLDEAIDNYRRAVGLAASHREMGKGPVSYLLLVTMGRRDLQPKLEQLQLVTQAYPDDIDAREQLLQLYLREMDQPAEAVKLITDQTPEELARYVPLAAEDPANLNPEQLEGLGEWYVRQAEETDRRFRGPLLLRARRVLETFLEKHKTEDLQHTRMELALSKVQEDIAELMPEARVRQPWVDLLETFKPDPRSNISGGQWTLRDGELQLRFSRRRGIGKAVLPAIPEGDYELEIAMTIGQGISGAFITVPAGGQQVAFVIGDTKHVGSNPGSMDLSALAMVEGKDQRNQDNPTLVSPARISRDTRYLYRISVRSLGRLVQVRVSVNGKDYLSYKGSPESLQLPGWARTRINNAVVVGGIMREITVHQARIRMTEGELKEPPPAPQQEFPRRGRRR